MELGWALVVASVVLRLLARAEVDDGCVVPHEQEGHSLNAEPDRIRCQEAWPTQPTGQC